MLYVLDVLIAIFAMLTAYNIRVVFFAGDVTIAPIHIVLVPCVALLFGWGLSYAGAYQRLRIPIVTHLWVVASGLAFSLGALLTILFFILHDHTLSRLIIVFFVVIVAVATVSMRAFLVWWYFKRKGTSEGNGDRVLVVGTGERALRISELLKSRSEWGVDLVGFLDHDPAFVGKMIGDVKVLGTIDDIGAVLAQNVVDEVVVAVPRSMMNEIGKVFAACEEQGVKIKLMSDIFEFQVARMRLKILGGIPLLSFEPVAQDESALLLKRIFDISAVLAATPVLVPLFLLVAIAIRLDSKGPVFFVQNRVGLRKRIFPMYKFRSMVVDAEARLKEIEHLNEAEGPNFKIADDPRITRVGKFIRKTSLDELPQLINVLFGHMTIVGPRPMSVRDVNLFDKGVQRKRFSVRPGLTCLWQISGRSNLSFEKWLELDLAYIDNWSLALDMQILVKTIPVLLKGEGAV